MGDIDEAEDVNRNRVSRSSRTGVSLETCPIYGRTGKMLMISPHPTRTKVKVSKAARRCVHFLSLPAVCPLVFSLTE